jgi:magnesium chelatase family protein
MVGFQGPVMLTATSLISGAMQCVNMELGLAARAYHCILKLARTIVDLATSGEIQSMHLAEALQ